MLFRSHHANRTLRFEALQRRDMMAGDVTVELSGADSRDLVINGDAEGNIIEIRSVGEDRIQVRPRFDFSSGSAISNLSLDDLTRVNGGTIGVEFTVTDDIRIFMGGGDDKVFVENLALNGQSHADLVIEMDAGHDFLSVRNTEIARTLYMTGSTGDDGATVRDSEFGGDLTLDLGSGVSSRTQSATVSNVEAADDIYLLGGSFATRLTARNAQAGDNLHLDGGTGDDVLTVDDCAAEDVFVYGGTGDDKVVLENVAALDQLYANLGSGDDTLHVEGSSADRPTFIGGPGNDKLTHVWWLWGNENSFLANLEWSE